MASLRSYSILFVLVTPVLAASHADLVIQSGHHIVRSAHFSPDGHLVVTAGDNVARLWDATTGDELRVFRGHSALVQTAYFSPSGKTIVTAGQDSTIRLWDAATGQEQAAPIHAPGVTSAVFSPDGKQILGTVSGGARLWDVASGQAIRDFNPGNTKNATPCRAVAFSPDGSMVAASGFDGPVQVWNSKTGNPIRELSGSAYKALGHEYSVHSLAFSPDGRFILTGGAAEADAARLWDVASGNEIRQFKDGRLITQDIKAVAFSSDGTKIITGAGQSVIWEAATGRLISRLPTDYDLQMRNDYGGPETVEFSPDGRSVLFGGIAGVVIVHLATEKVVQTFKSNSYSVRSIGLSKDGSALLTDSDGVHLWNLATGTVTTTTGDLFNRFALSPDGRVVAKSIGSRLVVFDPLTDQTLLRFQAPNDAPPAPRTREELLTELLTTKIGGISFSPNGRWIATTEEHSTLGSANPMAPRSFLAQIWDAASGKRTVISGRYNSDSARIEGGLSEGIPAAVFSPDSEEILTAGDDKIVRLSSATSGKELYKLEAYDATPRAGTGLTRVCPENGTQAESCRTLRRYEDFNLRAATSAAAFSPDGNRIVTGGERTVRLWDRKTRMEVRKLRTSDTVETVAFSADSRSIAAGGGDGVVRIWNADSGQEVRSWLAHSGTVKSILFHPNGRLIFSASEDGTTRIWELNSGRLIATLANFNNGGWAVVDSDGRFDTGSLDGDVPLRWVVSDEPFRGLPVQVFMRQYYTPQLLERLMASAELADLPKIAEINRVLPRIDELKVEPIAGEADRVRVRVRAAQQNADGHASGIRDIRLFRDDQLVGMKAGPLRDGEYVFDNVWLPLSKSVEFSTYALNSASVKSETVRARYELREIRNPPDPRTFILNIGVNKTQAVGCHLDLQYAASDALAIGDVLASRLLPVQRKTLVSDTRTPNGASKTAVRNALAEIAKQSTPADRFVMTFSGHGYTSRKGQFYIFPSSLNGRCGQPDDSALLASAISSDELAEWLRPVDAGEMVIVLDACASAASVESGDFKPGPMGSVGLGQLAYDKRIRILAASQTSQQAFEAESGMGTLTYALVSGLDLKDADWKPKDGRITLREWLSYGVIRVPQLYRKHFGGLAEGFTGQTPALFDFRTKDNEGVTLDPPRKPAATAGSAAGSPSDSGDRTTRLACSSATPQEIRAAIEAHALDQTIAMWRCRPENAQNPGVRQAIANMFIESAFSGAKGFLDGLVAAGLNPTIMFSPTQSRADDFVYKTVPQTAFDAFNPEGLRWLAEKAPAAYWKKYSIVKFVDGMGPLPLNDEWLAAIPVMAGAGVDIGEKDYQAFRIVYRYWVESQLPDDLCAGVSDEKNNNVLGHPQIAPVIALHFKNISEALAPQVNEDRRTAKMQVIADFVAADLTLADSLISSAPKDRDALLLRKRRLVDFQQELQNSEGLAK